MEISLFYTSVPKIVIICHTFPEMWHVTDIIVIFHFGSFLLFYHPLTNQRTKISKNETIGDIII